MTLPDLLLPTYAQMLRALSAWLEKAGAAREDGGDGLLTARLAPDMFPLATQVRFACVQAYEGVAPARAIAHALPQGMIFDLSAEQYARDWAIPQFYFHVMTAYAILRAEGAALGKADYVAHMFAYLRPGTMPG